MLAHTICCCQAEKQAPEKQQLPYRLNEWSNCALTGGHVCWHAHAVVTQNNDAHAVAI